MRLRASSNAAVELFHVRLPTALVALRFSSQLVAHYFGRSRLPPTFVLAFLFDHNAFAFSLLPGFFFFWLTVLCSSTYLQYKSSHSAPLGVFVDGLTNGTPLLIHERRPPLPFVLRIDSEVLETLASSKFRSFRKILSLTASLACLWYSRTAILNC